MKKWIIVLLCFYVNIEAQMDIEYLNDVPVSFKEKYYSSYRNYNPLQVGNIWQYYDAEEDFYISIKILQDSVINGRRYYKKLYYPELTINPNSNISWERNDTTSGVTFMLDIQDVNNNGDTLEELPIDSLENPYWSRYKSYKYLSKDTASTFVYKDIRTVLVGDTSWAIIEGDTVITRSFQIIELFWTEEIADKFGITLFSSESPYRYLTGAIINGKQYGTLVNVEKASMNLPTEIRLENNYPNPFNPTTTIKYTIPTPLNPPFAKGGNARGVFITLKVYDILGNEVSTLVNKQQSPGNYSVIFDANNLPSGVYFYTLRVNSLVQNKKMMLLR